MSLIWCALFLACSAWCAQQVPTTLSPFGRSNKTIAQNLPINLTDVDIRRDHVSTLDEAISTVKDFNNASQLARDTPLSTFVRPKLKVQNESIYFEVATNVKQQHLSHLLKLSLPKNMTGQKVIKGFQVSGSYGNHQNILSLVQNVDARLRNMRNAEMLVTVIQEIFDSLDFTSSSNLATSSKNRFDFSSSSQDSTKVLEKDVLKKFCDRLATKLQKATNVVMDLRNFLRSNITELIGNDNIQKSGYNAEGAIASEDPASDLDVDERTSSTFRQKLFLQTIIELCQYDASSHNDTLSSYNRSRIKTINNEGADISDPSKKANRYILAKIRELSSILSETEAQNLKLDPKSARLTHNNVKHIYFLSRSDHARDNGGELLTSDLNFQQLYVSAIKHKFVFFLIDVGSAGSANHLDLSKQLIITILKLLSETDLISIVTVASNASAFALGDLYSSNQTSRHIYAATRDQKKKLTNYINILRGSNEPTNLTLGFQYSFQLLEEFQKSKLITAQNPIEFVYVSGGLHTNCFEARHVLSIIAQGQQKLIKPIVINTCAVVIDENRIMNEKQFFIDISEQNYSKYNINVSAWYDQRITQIYGKFLVLTKNNPELLKRSSMEIFEHSFIKAFLSRKLQIHEPVVDLSTRDTIVSITHAVPSFGVVGVNLFLSDLVEDVLNYNSKLANDKHKRLYAFLIDRSGRTLAHPALPPPTSQRETPFPVFIGFLENNTVFSKIQEQILYEQSGVITANISIKINEKAELTNRVYLWQSVLGIYIICLATTIQPNTFPNADASFLKEKYTSTSSSHDENYRRNPYREFLISNDMLYHRLDLLPPQSSRVCSYLGQIGSFDVGTVYLSASAFESSFAFSENSRNKLQNLQIRTIESIMAYIKDTTGLLANPGLHSNVRHDVTTLYKSMQYLKKRHQDPKGLLKKYIIRRYIATLNGVLQIYPGCQLSSSYDPTTRSWFRKAIQQPGKVIFSVPYLDAGGAGYVITVAHTIFQGKLNALHSIAHDRPVAVVALDMPYAYFYKMLLDSSPLCRQDRIKCLLFENEGYLVAHPSMLEASTTTNNQRRPHEHITHKESFLANDILYHKKLVRKLACVNYQNRTIQRFYVYNTSLTDILTNVVHGERTKYAISVVPGSNIFAVVLNSSCNGGAFCPCSTIDRTCLNCNRMDQTECECPCECPMDLYDDQSSLKKKINEFPNIHNNYTLRYSYCEPSNEDSLTLSSINKINVLRSCVDINCDIYGTQTDCLAVIGCEWCQLDVEGNIFSPAFCTSQFSCFNGVLSSRSPYGDNDDSSSILAVHVLNSGQKQKSYSVFGPVAGAILVLALVIGFAIFCYRHSHASDQFYVDSVQEDNYGVPLSRFNFDNYQNKTPSGYSCEGESSLAKRNYIHPANISPYHMSSGSSYHRPPNGESDHGYYTMTPHEDLTDQQSFTLAEPLLSNENLQKNSDTISISTSISSPKKHHQQKFSNQCLCEGRCNKVCRQKLVPPKFGLIPKTNTTFDQTAMPITPTTASNEQQLYRHYLLAPVTVHCHMETSE